MIGAVELRDPWSHYAPLRDPWSHIAPSRLRMWTPPAGVATVVSVALAAAASLSPAMLPRPAWVQGVVTGMLVLVGLGLGRVLTIPARRVRWTPPRLLVCTVCGSALGVAALALVNAHHWQNALRAATGSATVGVDYWQTVGVVATSLVLGIIGAWQWLRRPRSWTRPVVATAFALIVVVVAVTAIIPMSRASAVDPVTPAATRSGSPESSVSFESLRSHGRSVVTGGPAQQIRVYVSPDTAPDPADRAAQAIAELDRTNAWQRPVILVAVPTGSGWVDTRALTGFTNRFGADSAVVAAAYSALPSWLASLVSRDDAIDTTSELLAGIERRVSSMPVAARPRVLLYGQSLGATAGAEASKRLWGAAAPLCGQFLVGPPVGTPISATTTVMANTSDPVVVWSPRLALEPPVPTDRRADAPRPGWLPVLSFLQTTVDLMTAQIYGPDHGHTYGTDQVDGPLYCAPDPVTVPNASAAPLATSNAAATR